MDSWFVVAIVAGAVLARILHPFIFRALTGVDCRRRRDKRNDDNDDNEAGIALLSTNDRRVDQLVTAECERLQKNILNRNDPWTQHLRLRGMRITQSEVAALADALRENTTVAWVDLSANPGVGDEGARALAAALAVNAGMKDVDLSETRLGQEGAAALGGALVQRWKRNPQEDAANGQRTRTCLLSLRLNKNHVGAEGAADFANAFMEAGAAETTSELEGQVDGTATEDGQGDQETTPTITSGLDMRRLPALVELQLDYNELGDVGAVAMASLVMSSSTPLRALRLRENGITVEGIRHLAVALSHPNCQLREFYVGGNDLGDEGVELLARAIAGTVEADSSKEPAKEEEEGGSGEKATEETKPEKATTTALADKAATPQTSKKTTTTTGSGDRPRRRHSLAVLDLSRCNMTSVGLAQLSHHLHEAIQNGVCEISDLNLSQNILDDAGIMVFSHKVLSCAPALRAVELWGNQLSNAGGRCVATAIAASPSPVLESINMRYNRLLTDRNLLRGMDVLLEQKRQGRGATTFNGPAKVFSQDDS